MGNRGIQVVLVVLAITIGVGAAYGYSAIRGKSTATKSATTSATPSAGASSTAPTPRAGAAPEASASPQASPAASPSAQASPTQAPSGGGGGPAAYPPQIQAGFSASYSGSGTLMVQASDGIDVGSAVCAGINESTQAFPAGYGGAFFAAIQFSDGDILSAGYVKTTSERHDFAESQKGSSTQGVVGSAGSTASGSHTYCVAHTGAGWTFTDDGSAIKGADGTTFTFTGEAASDTRGAQVRFVSSAQRLDPSQPKASFNLTVPGFHDLTVGGQAPRQLRGSTFYV